MSEMSSRNRAVWMDIPVANLDRAAKFYRAVLGVSVQKETFEGGAICVLEHHDGNGGCLVLEPDAITPTGGILVYLNVDGRIRDALAQAEQHGGKIVQALHPIGPHGYRAVVLDSEGNRIALHSNTDA